MRKSEYGTYLYGGKTEKKDLEMFNTKRRLKRKSKTFKSVTGLRLRKRLKK